MENQLLEGAGGSVLGSPGFELVSMSQQQFGQIKSIFGVVLGATGDESLTEFEQRERINGIEGNPIVGLQEWEQVHGRLLQADGHAGVGMFLAQLSQPFPESLWGGGDGVRTALASLGLDEMQVGFGVGTIQADDQVIARFSVHSFFGY